MKKVSIWTWFAPIAVILLVLSLFTGGFTRSLGYRQDDHVGKVQVSCQLYPVGEGWGFDIVAENRKVIHQDRIPAINHRRPFSTKEDAEKVGRLMIDKMKNGIFPPMITTQDMQALGIELN